MQSQTLRIYVQYLRAVGQSLLLTLFALMLVVVFAYSLTASAPVLGDLLWSDAARFGAQYWLTAFGAQITIGSTVISYLPGTLLLLMFWCAYVVIRRLGVANWLDVAVITGYFAVTVALVGVLAWPTGAWWTAIIGASLCGAIAAMLAGREALFEQVSANAVALDAVAVARWFCAAVLLVSVLAFFAGFLTNTSTIFEIQAQYRQGVLGVVGLIALQLLYVPNFLVSAFAWITGAGVFAGGVSTSALGGALGPLPAIPVLAALPVDGAGKWPALFLPVLCFLALGVYLVLRHADQKPSHLALALSTAGGGVAGAFIVAFFGFLSHGAIGPGRMSDFGVHAQPLFAYTLLICVLPMLLGTLGASFISAAREKQG